LSKPSEGGAGRLASDPFDVGWQNAQLIELTLAAAAGLG
jgi:hypothetical protein